MSLPGPPPAPLGTAPLGLSRIPGSPYEVVVLQEGYSRALPDGSTRADGSVTLLRGPRLTLVDTGGPWGRERLMGLLAAQGVAPGDVSHVVCTHGHSDHAGNLNLFPGATLLILIPAIHIQATGRQGCCGNRCGMFLSILFALVGVAGSIYAVSVSALGLVNGPLCQVRESNGSLGTWGQPFLSTDEELSKQSYLFNTSMWDTCVNPPGVVQFNVILFSLVLAAALLELLLCGVQVLNGLFGCLCGTCNKKQARDPKQTQY